ncbi:Phosphatidylinositol 3,4,5-trisphosphate 3-phosphatase and dual-specificity protein phosphatase PTEN [Neolecta irregularis DAH-3]|uniref:phosphatidylinositol-3,4,5-trisphosphate 3-phosphatase n=1 Tax=Neolecta irregularis (strain DAH-3) TaxID=1198029 RepID=A0A1U7LKZ0_NEOID|nr:Phosphatidylinositol 3,4,5-trisphosphate 3-phosphatase and dual-specificity protein phosphatase PTEN [Neolecta irregularis DAH-3]|eukprot:OLL23317.1 Phosphatidylinositol 3,4,5-trisphosphate 3-phosphatase and dual-specificity protein phosphatase PTEN [Neolecta irregularis DAH-3]
MIRSLIAHPRIRHTEDHVSLDLAYITPQIIVMSMPAAWPKSIYRNSIGDVRSFLDTRHPNQWWIWEFMAEGAGYTNNDMDNRVSHFQWPDHYPPPFALIHPLVTEIHSHIASSKEAIAVLHCKAGKGRSGSVSCYYLINQGWTATQALEYFTEKRMKYGRGVSIPSQVRWVGYAERWVKDQKRYEETEVNIKEVCVHGTEKGIQCLISRYIENGLMVDDVETLGVKSTPKSHFSYRPTSHLRIKGDVCVSLWKTTAYVTISTTRFWFNPWFEESPMIIKWEDCDGFKGTQKRGKKLFAHVEIYWDQVWPKDRNKANKTDLSDVKGDRAEEMVGKQDTVSIKNVQAVEQAFEGTDK